MSFAQRLSEWIEAFRIAGEQLRSHKSRSLLTALGVIIGIVAVTLMGTAIKGIDKGFSDSLDLLGQDVLFIQKWPWGDVGDDWWRYRNRPHIDLDHAAEINRSINRNPDSALQLAVPVKQPRGTVRREDRSISSVEIIGTDDNFLLIGNATLQSGRFFTRSENQSRSRVVILGFDVADTLFPAGIRQAVGKEVTIAGRKFRVLGIMERQGSFLGMQSFDKQVILPLRSLLTFYRHNWSNNLRLKAAPGVPMEWAVDEATGLLRRLRGLQPDEPNNFEINRSETIEEQIGPVKTGIALAGFFITGLALFVGAIGIMNITFVSVRERTREIGTRRALGARRHAILLQFLVEAVSICLLGGLLGLATAFGLQQAVSAAFPDFPFTFSGDLVAMAFTLSVLTGVASGLAPAYQAARLDPANALRHE